MIVSKLLPVVVILTALVMTGCGREDRDGERIERPHQSESERQKVGEDVEISLSEEDYIEYTARLRLRQKEHQQEFARAMEEGDLDKVEELQAKLREKAQSVRSQMGISSEELREFEQQKPGFMGKNETQEKINQKLEKLHQE